MGDKSSVLHCISLSLAFLCSANMPEKVISPFHKNNTNQKTAKSQQNLIFTCAFGWSPECWHVLIGCWHAAVVSWELFGGFKWVMSSDVGYSNLSIFTTLLYLSTFIIEPVKSVRKSHWMIHSGTGLSGLQPFSSQQLTDSNDSVRASHQ